MLLKGIRVLDLSTLLPGPMCSLFLADLGAEVIKVESLKGDMMRRFESHKGKSPYFSALNRNKKSIAINLKTSKGKQVFMKLAENADVIIEGFRPGKVGALGIDYHNVKKINPKIIYCSITGYGQEGKYKDKAGHDLNYSSLSGMLDVLSSRPFVPGIQIADISCAFIAAFSIAAALFSRERNGKGDYIDVSVFNSALCTISMHIAQRSACCKSDTLSGKMPCYNVYRTKDGKHVSLGAIEGKFWQSFCTAANRKGLLTKQFDISAVGELESLFKSKTRKEWIKLNKKYDFCCEPVNTVEEAINEPYNKSKFIEIDGIRQAAMPFIFSSLGKTRHSRAPNLGENTKEMLLLAGCDKKSAEELIKEGVAASYENL